jgi:hypothetical protein
MAYIKTVWVNGVSPAINDTNLNKIEQGIYDSLRQDGTTAMSAQLVTVAGDATTQVFFGIESVSHSGLTFNVLDPLANYVLLTVPTDAETDRVVMRSSKGWATSPGTLTILP